MTDNEGVVIKTADTPATTATATTTGHGVSRRKRVLIVDDEADHAGVIKMVLEDTDRIDADFFTNSALVMPNYKMDFYDLLLLDAKMPRLNGFELYSSLKRENMLGRERVCFMTADELFYETLKEEFPKLDVGCFIKKPFSIDELTRRLERELAMS